MMLIHIHCPSYGRGAGFIGHDLLNRLSAMDCKITGECHATRPHAACEEQESRRELKQIRYLIS